MDSPIQQQQQQQQLIDISMGPLHIKNFHML